jgi:hypothetical protein
VGPRGTILPLVLVALACTEPNLPAVVDARRVTVHPSARVVRSSPPVTGEWSADRYHHGNQRVSFDEAWKSRVGVNAVGLKTPMTVLGRNALIENKRATGRPQDLANVAKLESVKESLTAKKRAKKKSSVLRRKRRS